MAREYLKLALKNPESFQHILAVTFTNKATQEMKSRILESLESLSAGSSSIKYELSNSLNLSEDQLGDRANLVLKNILHNYSAFSVSTIDSFFQKVVRTFAREMGIQGGFNVELDQKKVISESVDRLLLEVGQNEKLTEWLTQFAFHNINEGRKWDSKGDIKKLSDELFKELFILKKDAIFEKMKDSQFMISFIESLNDIKIKFESTMTSIGSKGLKLIYSNGLSIDDFTQKQRGVGGYFEKLSKSNIQAPNSFVLAAFNEQKWYGAKSDKKTEIEAVLFSGLQNALEEAVTFYESNFTEYFTTISIVKNIYVLGILSEVSDYLNLYRDENDSLLISDFPVFLNQIIRDSDTPYIYEKIGSKYKHYLIDEFQDTSGLQWNNFKPLVKNSLASNHFNMIVGDIKQSIYRWRDGNLKLLLEDVQNEIGEEEVEIKDLNTNWRSRKNIIDFNNNLFKVAPNLLYDQLKKGQSLENAEAESIKNAYHDSFQQIADNDNSSGGLVSVIFFETKNTSEFDDLSLDLMINRINELQDANYRLKDIAILVRTAKEGKKVTDALVQHEKSEIQSKYKYDIISNESLYLKNLPVVNLLVQSLYFILNEKEALHRAQLKYAFDWHFTDNKSESYLNAETILEARIIELNSMALVDLIEEVIRLFDLKKNIDQLPYLIAFQDTIVDYSKNNNSSIEGFLQWWKDNPNRSVQVSENQDAIRLMTIHKSKGLQFKTVILPFCKWELDQGSGGDRQNIVWCSTEGEGPFSMLPFLPLKYKADMSQTLFSSNYLEEKVKAYMDNLNLLYVACTRAEEVLYIMTNNSVGRGGMAKVSDLLYQVLNRNEVNLIDQGEQNLEYTLGEMVDYTVYDDDEVFDKQEISNLITESWSGRRELQTKQVDFWLDEDIQFRIDEGKMIHKVLSLIDHISDLENAVAQIAIQFNLDEKEKESLQNKLNDLFKKEQIRNWFAKDWLIKNETNILTREGGVLRPDRVMIKNDEAVIIDYKTGIQSDTYKKQVKSYQLLLQDMGYKSVKGYLLYVNDCAVIEVA